MFQVQFSATDDLSGVTSFGICFRNDQSSQYQLGNGWVTAGLAVTGSVSVTIPQFAAAGTWTVAWVTVTDRTGNQTLLGSEALAAMGFPVQLVVFSVEDTIKPSVVSYNYPEFIDTSSGPASLAITFSVADDLSGAKSFGICLRNSASGQYQIGNAWFPPSVAATGTATVNFPQHAAGGTWDVSWVQVRDQAGNETLLSPGDLAARGLQTQLTVVSEQDTHAPTLISYAFSGPIDTTKGPANLNVGFEVADDLSGAVSFSISFQHPATGQYQIGYASFGPALSSTGTATIRFPQYAASGPWSIAWVQVKDKAGNELLLAPETLAALGLPVKVTVLGADTTPPTIEPTMSGPIGTNGWFTGPVTVSWTVADSESGIASSSGCDSVYLPDDTFGTGLTCTATNGVGMTSSWSVVVKIDSRFPKIVVPGPIVVEASSPTGEVVPYVATASDSGTNVVPSCVPVSGSVFPLGVTTVSCTAVDEAGNQSRGSFTIKVQDTTAPTIDVPPVLTLEASGPNGTVATYEVTARDAVSNPIVTCSRPSGTLFPLGSTVVVCTARDAAGNTSTGTLTVIVQDTVPPNRPVATASQAVLWPADHGLITVRIAATSVDAVTEPSRLRCQVIGVTSNEPDRSDEAGDLAPDWVLGANGLEVGLRAERRGDGSGRVYTVAVACSDAAANRSEPAFVTVVVPHDQRK